MIAEIELTKNKLLKLIDFLKELKEVKPYGSLQDYKSNSAIKRSCER